MNHKPALSIFCSALLLAACGGGGGGGGSGSGGGFAPITVAISAPSGAVNNAGTTMSVSGSASTPTSILKSLAWTVTPAGATLSNADCASGTRSGEVYTANSQAATGTSSWSCAVGIKAPIVAGNVSNPNYTLTLTGIDDKGNVKSAAQEVTFAAATSGAGGASNGFTSKAGNNFIAAPGSKNNLFCSASGGTEPYVFSWSVLNNGGLNLPLSTYAGAETSFVAPTEIPSGPLSFACVATDANKFSANSTVSATISLAPGASTLVANAGPGFTAAPGSKNNLFCSASGGTAPYVFSWSVLNNGGLNLPLSTYAGAATSFVAPTEVLSGPLSFACVATDANKLSANSTVSATINPAPAAATLVANAGLGFNSAAGSKSSLHCDATGGVAPYTFQWVVSDNGGYNVALSSYTGADVSFTSPAVIAQTVISTTCRATDSLQTTSSSIVSATITPPVVGAGSSLVASIAQPATAATPGSTITLDGSASGWFDSVGKTTGPAIVYAWTSSDPAVVISNRTASKTSVTFPSSYLTATNVQFTLVATSGTKSSSSTVNVLVDVYGPFSLSIAPSATATVGNKAISIVATATSGAGSPTLYYRWTQVSGPAVILGGNTTSTLGVTLPTVAPGTTASYVFRVAVGYSPITSTYPGIYFGDATVTVTP